MNTSPGNVEASNVVGSSQKMPIAIAVMGATGTGKSSLIKLITRNENIKVGHSVNSETSEVQLINYMEPDGRHIAFIDTPGFDDNREDMTDADILQQIADFLSTEFQDGRTLNGVMYLHRITDTRMGGISVRNLNMFRKLCGEESLKNVAIVTTQWDKILELEGKVREKELMTSPNFFQPLVEAHARVFQHNNTPESARSIMKQLLGNSPTVLQIQKELKEGKSVLETQAGMELSAHVNRLIQQHRQELEKLRCELEAAITTKNKKLEGEMKGELARISGMLEKREDEKKTLEMNPDDYRVRRKEEKGRLEEQDNTMTMRAILAEVGATMQREREAERAFEKLVASEVRNESLRSELRREIRIREVAEDEVRTLRGALDQERGRRQHEAKMQEQDKAAVDKQLAELRQQVNMLLSLQSKQWKEEPVRVGVEGDVKKERRLLDDELEQRQSEVKEAVNRAHTQLTEQKTSLHSVLLEEKRIRAEEKQEANEARAKLVSEMDILRSHLQEEKEKNKAIIAQEQHRRIDEEKEMARRTMELIAGLKQDAAEDRKAILAEIEERLKQGRPFFRPFPRFPAKREKDKREIKAEK